MILRAYIMKNDGEQLLARSYESEEGAEKADPMPAHVRSCVLLFHSRESTTLEQAYTLEQCDTIWTYVFYENFAVIILASEKESQLEISKRMLTIGRAIARTFGQVIEFWCGDMSDIEGIEELVDSIITMSLDAPKSITPEDIEILVTKTLETHQVAYAGIFDAQGEMLGGNVPESHISYIQEEIGRGLVSASVGLMPTEIKFRQHRIHILSVYSLTVAVGTYRADSRIKAVGATSEIAKSLDDLFLQTSTTAK